MRYHTPGAPGSLLSVEPRYGNFVNGTWSAPRTGAYRANPAPATGEPFCEVPRSGSGDLEGALGAAGRAASSWAGRPGEYRADVLDEIAAAIDARHEALAVADSWDSGKPVRETRTADIPLAAHRFRRFAALARDQTGAGSETETPAHDVRFHARDAAGWNISLASPLLTVAWKLAPALAAGRCAVLTPAFHTPWSVLKLAEVLEGIVPPGVVGVVNGAGMPVGDRIRGRPAREIDLFGTALIGAEPIGHQGESADVVFADVVDADDAVFDSAVESLAGFAFNRSAGCAHTAHALIERRALGPFMERFGERLRLNRPGDPLDTDTVIGPQESAVELDELASRVRLARSAGAQVLIGGRRAHLEGALGGGYFYEPTVLQCDGASPLFRQGIPGPVLVAAAFEGEAEALRQLASLRRGLAVEIRTRDARLARRIGGAVEANGRGQRVEREYAGRLRSLLTSERRGS